MDSLSLVQDSQGALQRDGQVLDGKIAEIHSRLGELQDQATAVGKLPAMLVQTMVKLEDELETYHRQREEIKITLSRDRILSKDDFFSLLDLVSFEGRARANALIKSLNILVKVGRPKNPRTSLCINYSVYQSENLFLHVMDDGEDLVFTPLTRSLTELANAQGDQYGPALLKRLTASGNPMLRPVSVEMLTEVHRMLLEQFDGDTE